MNYLQNKLTLPRYTSVENRVKRCNHSINELLQDFLKSQNVYVSECGLNVYIDEYELGESRNVAFEIVQYIDEYPEQDSDIFTVKLIPYTIREEYNYVYPPSQEMKFSWKERIKILFKGKIERRCSDAGYDTD